MAKTSKPKSPAAASVRPRYGKSEKLHAEAVKVMPGGVSSPVRSFLAVSGPRPTRGASATTAVPSIFIKEGKGPHLVDVDNNAYLDYVMSYGPLIGGHCPAVVRAAVARQIDKGSSYGCCSEYEIILAKAIAAAMPQVPMVRFVNSGTEAAMSAIRLARGATKRDIVIKCAGCYHGHVDSLLVEAGSGATTHGHPSSPGIPDSVTHSTALMPFNDLDAARQLFDKIGGKTAAIILEPVCGNVGVIPPAAGYLEGLRALCDQHGALLIFDEVMTGFRVAHGGAQALYSVKPDITCLGKIIGGGLPVGAYGGRVELMQQVSPAGPIYQAGTLSGNPLSMSAGIATLSLLEDGTAYPMLERLGARLEAGLRDAAAAACVAITVQRVGSMLTPFFLSAAQAAAAEAAQSTAALTPAPTVAETPALPEPPRPTAIRNYADALQCDTQAFATFFRAMLDRGIMLPPSQFEAWFVSTAHTEADIDQTIEAAKAAFAAVRAETA